MSARKMAVVTVGLVLAVLFSAIPSGSAPMASIGDVLYNGGFEQGFQSIGGCGMVGVGWGCFTNGGTAAYGFYDDQWSATVFAGQHSQLIEINTKEKGGDPDRNAGIFQRVAVYPGVAYELSLKGMIRADDGGGDPWRYRVYVGFDYTGGTDWKAVTDWRELPWDTYYPRTSPGAFSSYSTPVVPTTGALTVFVRTQRKWGTWYEETDFNLDAISLFGPAAPPVVHPPVTKPIYPPVTKPIYPPVVQPPVVHPPVIVQPPTPVTPSIVCDGPNLLWNGNFEYGFQPNGVANSWFGFTNGGRANYGFYDEQWPAVVSEGKHGQLIEINTKNLPNGTDPDRVAGISQMVWLQPGALYQFSLDALMREEPTAADEDFYRTMVLWGYSRVGARPPAALEFQERVPLTEIYPRTEPGPMQSYSTRFVAPGGYTTISLWALKKWATENRELDVNLDNVALRMCRTTPVVHPPVVHPPVVHPPVVHPPVANPCTGPGEVWYKVQRGDTLSQLAAQYNTSVKAIMAVNGLANPNLIFAGQMLCIPDPPAAASQAAPTVAAAPSNDGATPELAAAPSPASATEAAASAPVTATDAAAAAVSGDSASASTQPAATGPTTYRVQRGDTLSGIAVRFNTTVAALMAQNQISNANFIYAGQQLQLP